MKTIVKPTHKVVKDYYEVPDEYHSPTYYLFGFTGEEVKVVDEFISNIY